MARDPYLVRINSTVPVTVSPVGSRWASPLTRPTPGSGMGRVGGSGVSSVTTVFSWRRPRRTRDDPEPSPSALLGRRTRRRFVRGLGFPLSRIPVGHGTRRTRGHEDPSVPMDSVTGVWVDTHNRPPVPGGQVGVGASLKTLGRGDPSWTRRHGPGGTPRPERGVGT